MLNSSTMRRLTSHLAAVALLLLTTTPLSAADIPAFPGAEGFGAYATGGRGGRVLHVTNLDDNGEGSLRWAIDQEGPRTVVFDVSGTIKLRGGLTIRKPNITIAGQTAPGDGICLRDAGLSISTDDVVIRFIRCRLGDEGREGDALSLSDGHDIIVDHCSGSWSTDEVLSASTHNPTLTRLTVQWCFIAEALNAKGHGYGSLIRGTGGAKFSYLHNLYAHNYGRNPRPGNYDDNPVEDDPDGLLLDFRNNVIYDWGGGHAGYNNDHKSRTRMNYVGNYLKAGSASTNNGIAYKTCSPFDLAYFAGNLYEGQPADDPWAIVKYHEDWTPEIIASFKQASPFETGPIREEDAATAYERVLRIGGAIRPKRDAVDARIVADVKTGAGGLIDSQSEVGGWPDLASAPAPSDADQDGMPDAWETAHGFDPASDADGPQDKDGDGYTNLEEFLNNTDPAVAIDYTKPENNVSSLD
jgi:hypothetical protein